MQPSQDPTIAPRKLSEKLCKGTCRQMGIVPDTPWWIPGVVVVEFKNAISPEWFPTHLLTPEAELLPPWLDFVKIHQILASYTQIKSPEWTFAYEPGTVPESGRRRFITFFFGLESPVVQIAEKFQLVRGIVHAAPEPRLSPYLEPSLEDRQKLLFDRSMAGEDQALRDEPLATSGGHPLGRAVTNISTGIQNQWYLFRCKADSLLENGHSGRGIVIADIDWGFRLSHDELSGHIEFPLNIEHGDDNVSRGTAVSHGTGVLGILGAQDNDKGMLGFAPEADLWAIQAGDRPESLNNKLWAQAIDCVRDKSSNGRRKIIIVEAQTVKGGNVEMSSIIGTAIIGAISRRAVVCVPAGDGGGPAHLDHCGKPIPVTGSILIGATAYRDDPNDLLRGFSNFGPRVDVSAPGEPGADVTCCDCGDNYYTNSFGATSGAAPKVAGAIALMLEQNPSLTHQRIRQILRTVGPVIPPTNDDPIGHFLDVAAAVHQAKLDKNPFKRFFSRVFKLIGKLLGRH